MPLLDSFCVDHVKMQAPGVRLAKSMKTPKGDDISVFDLRFCKPNEEILPEKGTHTLEHLFAGFMRNHLNGNGVEIIDISPMGCRTGFYMSLIGTPSEEAVKKAWLASMKDILENIYYGISLMAGRVKIGDYIVYEGTRGRVSSINYTSTIVEATDGSIIAFQNSQLFTKSYKTL